MVTVREMENVGAFIEIAEIWVVKYEKFVQSVSNKSQSAKIVVTGMKYLCPMQFTYT